jgi:transposase
MAGSYEHYDPSFKQRVLEWYEEQDPKPSWRAVAEHWRVKSENSVRQWYADWDGTVESLARKHGGGRKRKLTEEESKAHIKDFVIEKNREGKAVCYADAQKRVKEETGKDVSVRTVRRYGLKDHGLTYKWTTRKLKIEGSSAFLTPIPLAHLTLVGCGGVFCDRDEGVLGGCGRGTTRPSTGQVGSIDLY